MADFIIPADLVAATSQAVVDRYFDDDGDGLADPSLVALLISNTCSAIATTMLEGWSEEQIAKLAVEPLFKMHAAFMALHLAAKRRTEWRNAAGEAPFRVDWADAQKYFKALASGNARSPKEAQAGTHPIIGGNLISPAPQQAAYVFAPDPNRGNRRGSGGY